MVLAERGDNLRNGRRSRGPSPNGHGTPDSSSEDENVSKRIGSSKASAKSGTYEAEKIRVGRDYQAVCPEMERIEERKPELVADRALLVWSPTKDIPDQKLEEYITVAKDKYGYNGEQALGMLFWHKHDLERAVLDLANFTPFPDEWTVEDKVLFEQAFQFHGKSFHRIRQMLPDKSIASLVKYYYSWKKSRSRSSLMDRQAKKQENNSENGSEHSNEDSDNEDKKWPIHRGIRRASGSNTTDDANSPANANQADITVATSTVTGGGMGGGAGGGGGVEVAPGKGLTGGGKGGTTQNCEGCGVQCTHTHTDTKGNRLCQSCHHHWRRTGSHRPTSGPITKRLGYGSSLNVGPRVKKLPKGMHMNHDDLLRLAKEQLQQQQLSNGANSNGQTGPNNGINGNGINASGNFSSDKIGAVLLQPLDREITSLKIQVQNNKQAVGNLKRKINETGATPDELRPAPENPAIKVTTKWTNEELLLAVQGVRKYGKDFQAIAEAIGTKTEVHVRAFFVNYRRRYNLDTVLRDHELEKGTQMEVDNEAATPAAESNSTTGQAVMETSK